MEWIFWVLLIVFIVEFLGALGGGTDDHEPQPPERREVDLFTLVVGIALGAAFFGDDDE